MNFLSKILKVGKMSVVGFLVVTFVCSTILFVPRVAVADNPTPPTNTNQNMLQTDLPPLIGQAFPINSLPPPTSIAPTPARPNQPAGNSCPGAWVKSGTTLGISFKAWGAAIVDVIFLDGPRALAKLSNDIFTWAITNIMEKPITRASQGGAGAAFVAGWKSVRDLANMLIVLGFVIVGLATTLRIREYEAKKALFPLIIVALLVNFSLLFCGLIIDAGNITTKSLLENKTDALGQNFVEEISKKEGNTLCEASRNDDLQKYTTTAIMFGVAYLIITACFVYLFLIILVRYAILGILFMLSPLAFAFWAFPFPKARELFQKWWESFLKWTFVGVCVAFFLWLANKILKQYDVKEAKDITLAIENLGVVILTLVTGVVMTVKQMGIASLASKAAIGIVSGGVGMMAGAVGGGASFLANKLGLSRAASRAKNYMGGKLEKWGLRQPGTTAGKAAKDIEEREKNVANLSTDQQVDLAKRNRPISLDAARNKVAAIQHLAKSGNLSKLGSTEDQKRALDYLENYQRDRGMLGKNEMSEARKIAMKQNPNLAPTPEKMKESIQKQTPSELAKNLSVESFTPQVIGAMDEKQMLYLHQKGSQAKRKAIADLVRTPDGRAKINAYVASLPTEKEKKKFGNNIYKAKEIFSPTKATKGGTLGYKNKYINLLKAKKQKK